MNRLSAQRRVVSRAWPLLVLAVVLVVALTCATAASPTAIAPPQASFPLTVTGSDGKAVTITRAPERIVAIDSAAVEILFAMGEGSRVVGTHDFASYPPEVANIPKIGNAFALNLEKIAELEPDLIYIFFGLPVPELEALGAPVLYLDSPSTLEGVVDQIRMWGRIVDNQEAGEEVARQFERTIAQVRETLARVDAGPRVFFLGDPTLWTIGQGTLMQEIFTLLKATNVFQDVSGFAQVSPEAIVARDPEVVLGVYTVGPEPLEVMEENPAFQQLSAYREGKVYRASDELLSTAGPRLTQGIQEVAKLLYPELFP